MAANDTGFEATDAKMAEYRELLGVDNIMIVKADQDWLDRYYAARIDATKLEEGYTGWMDLNGQSLYCRIATKAAILSVVGFLGIVAVSFYMQTLFALSSQSLTLTERVESISETIERSQNRAADLQARRQPRVESPAHRRRCPDDLL